MPSARIRPRVHRFPPRARASGWPPSRRCQQGKADHHPAGGQDHRDDHNGAHSPDRMGPLASAYARDTCIRPRRRAVAPSIRSRRSSAFATASWSTPRRLADAGQGLPRPRPHGDFRAMPASGGDLAILKWITSFPANPAVGLPVVMGMICVSTPTTAAPGPRRRARRHGAAHGRGGGHRRTGARPGGRRTAGIVGCGLHGAWAARCLAAAEFGPGICFDPGPRGGRAPGGELGWEAGSLEEALGCDVVTCVTPGAEPVVRERDDPPRHAPLDARRRRARARPRPSRPRWPRASCSATSGSRPPTAGSSRAPSRPGSCRART